MAIGLPTSTPAFQMAAMYGGRPDIPGFHYLARKRQTDILGAATPRGRRRAAAASCRAAAPTAASLLEVPVKISGLGRPGRPWTVEANGPIVLDTIRIFGVERSLFASNFPVDSLCADFDTIVTGFKTIIGNLSHTEQLRLFHDNAVQFYYLDSLGE
jgi:predicted TIM-barrel fold metal-dependent hydrolase